jgi:adhesin/invasin
VFLSLAVSGCDKVPLLAPTQSTISLTASAMAAPLNSQVEVFATVQENSGTPVQDGTLVTFTTTLGTLQPREQTTVRGVARVILQTGTTSGTATVNASSGGARTGAGTTNNNTTTPGTNVQILIGGAAATRVSVIARPGSVSSSGGTVEIIATVGDNVGNAIAGVAVNFSTERGTLSAATVTTDRNGEARTTLTTNAQTVVTARIGVGAGTGTTDPSATVTVGVNAVPSLTIGAITPTAPVLGQSISFTVTPAANTTVDATVDFGDGTSQNLGRINSQQTVSHQYTSAGTFTIRVTGRDPSTGESSAASTSVTIANRPPLSVTLTATSETAVPMVGQRWTFTATVTPATGGADQVETFTWNFGDGTSAVTSGNSTTHVYTVNGRKIVTVTVRTTDGRTASAQTEIIVTGAPNNNSVTQGRRPG